MKLIGSITENKYRDDLVSSKKYLYGTEKGIDIFNALKRIRGDIQTAYVLAHTPEQGEDILRILVDGKYVIGFALQQGGQEREVLNVITYSLKEYERLASSREARLKLAVAIDLSEKDLLSHFHRSDKKPSDD